MAVIIKPFQNIKSTNDKIRGKWYPRVVNVSTMNLEQLCDHIAEHGSIYTPDVVTGVVKKFVSCIQEQLLESKKVKLDGLGTFYLRPLFKTGLNEDGKAVYGGADEEDELLLSSVDFQVGFTPDRAKTSKYVGPNVSRKAARKSISQLGLAEKEDEDEETGGSGSGEGGNGGGGTINDEP